MSTSRSILFFAEKKSPVVKLIHKAVKEIKEKITPGYEPRIIKKGQYGDDCKAMESYGSMFIFPDGEDFEYFGGKDVFEDKYDEYNSKFKLWASFGGSSTTFKDLETGEKSAYPIYYFRLLMDKIKESGLENDVYLTCYTSSGGWNHKTYLPKIRKQWTGKFL